MNNNNNSKSLFKYSVEREQKGEESPQRRKQGLVSLTRTLWQAISKKTYGGGGGATQKARGAHCLRQSPLLNRHGPICVYHLSVRGNLLP